MHGLLLLSVAFNFLNFFFSSPFCQFINLIIFSLDLIITFYQFLSTQTFFHSNLLVLFFLLLKVVINNIPFGTYSNAQRIFALWNVNFTLDYLINSESARHKNFLDSQKLTPTDKSQKPRKILRELNVSSG